MRTSLNGLATWSDEPAPPRTPTATSAKPRRFVVRVNGAHRLSTDHADVARLTADNALRRAAIDTIERRQHVGATVTIHDDGDLIQRETIRRTIDFMVEIESADGTTTFRDPFER